MPLSVDTMNSLLAIGTVLLQFGTVLLLLLYFFQKKSPALTELAESVRGQALPLAWLLALVSTSISLIYSEVLGFLPCGLCWIQRIFLYPQVVLLAIAWKTRDLGVAKYSLALSLLGGLTALYHHAIQMGITEVLPCPVVATAAQCSARTLFEFGYITFPLMSFSGFAFMFVLMLFYRQKQTA